MTINKLRNEFNTKMRAIHNIEIAQIHSLHRNDRMIELLRQIVDKEQS